MCKTVKGIILLSVILLLFQETTWAYERFDSHAENINRSERVIVMQDSIDILMNESVNNSEKYRRIMTLSIVTLLSVTVLFWARSKN